MDFALSTKGQPLPKKNHEGMVSHFELEAFYLQLVASARSESIECAVTSGMACVALGVALATSDCDLLVAACDCQRFLEILSRSQFRGAPAQYRGTLSPPLSQNWLSGGWTAHFHWASEAYLDLFAEAPRADFPWTQDQNGLYVGPLTLAAMKKTDRERDWPQVTSLGLKLLESGDRRGWLSIYDETLLLELLDQSDCPPEMTARRPVLQLAAAKDPRLHAALIAEQLYWRELDRLRLATYQTAGKAYCAAVRSGFAKGHSLLAEHARREQLADALLPARPMRDLGLEPFLQQAHLRVSSIIQPEILTFLPDLRSCFQEICR